MGQQAILMGIPWRPILVAGADFDGTNDYMTTGSALTGLSDGKEGTISFWIRIDGGDGASLQVMAGDTTMGGGGVERFSVSRAADNTFQIRMTGTDNVIKLLINTVGTFTTSTTWHHVIASWNLASVGARHIYVDGVSDVAQTTFIDANIDYTLADYSIGADADGTDKMDGVLAELWFNPTYLDITDSANLQKFRTSIGKPADLGADGSIPLGSAPLVYQRIAAGAAASTFATNLGSSDDFSITGTLALGSTSPSD